MKPLHFALWLRGYLAARPDMANAEVREMLDLVLQEWLPRPATMPMERAAAPKPPPQIMSTQGFSAFGAMGEPHA